MRYETETFDFPDDYDGRVVATLVKAAASPESSRAVLYIHGYVDYFFQDHLAREFVSRGFNFYAVDLRKYGRSLLAGQHPDFAVSMREYYPDIDRGLERIVGDGNDDITLLGHSMGGLLAALYAVDGAMRGCVDRVVLNSPFLRFNARGYKRRIELPLAAGLSRLFPFIHSKSELPDVYAQSIHKDCKGEWDFDTRLKPVEGIPLYWSWLRAVRTAQKRVRRGLDIRVPVLVMSSDRSFYGERWSDEAMSSDAVLNVDDIKKLAHGLGAAVAYIRIEEGMHDLFLSRKEVREKAFGVMFDWIGKQSK